MNDKTRGQTEKTEKTEKAEKAEKAEEAGKTEENKEQQIEHKTEHNADMGNIPDDAKTSASKVSLVSKKKGRLNSNLIWIVLLAFVMLFIMLAGTGHKKESSNGENKNPQQLQQKNNFSAALGADLAKLRQMNNHTAAVPTKSTQASQASTVINVDNQPHAQTSFNIGQGFNEAKESKEYRARKNAPTSVYTAPELGQSKAVANNSSPQEAALAGQGANVDFANQSVQSAQTSSVQAVKIKHPNYVIASGEFVHAVLETAINSGLPGMVRALISTPVYSYTGAKVLVPAGSRLIGQYSSGIVQGQNRIMVVWNRVVLPNGIAIQINSPGTDALGIAGQGADSLETHFLARFGQATLLSLIGAGAATMGVSSNDRYNSASLYRAAVAQSFQKSAEKSLQGATALQPTIHIYQGAKINVFVAQDLSFYNVLVSQAHDVLQAQAQSSKSSFDSFGFGGANG